MKQTEEQRQEARAADFQRQLDTAPPFSTLWHLKVGDAIARGQMADVKPGAVIMARDWLGKCIVSWAWATVLEVQQRRVRIHWQREDREAWIPYLWTYRGDERHPLRNAKTSTRYAAALGGHRISRTP